MPRLHSPLWPNRRVKPPYGSVEVDWGHPLAPDRLCLLANEAAGGPIDLVTCRPGVFGGTAGYLPSWTSRGLRLNGGYIAGYDKESYVTLPRDPFMGLPSFTLLMRWRFNDVNKDASRGLIGNWHGDGDMSVLVFTNGGGAVYTRVAGNGIGTANSTATPQLTDNWCRVAIAYNGSTVTQYLGANDGPLVQDGQVSVSGTVRTPTTLGPEIGRYNSNSVTCTSADIEFVYVLSRPLSLAECGSLFADPYRFLRPVLRRSYGFVGAAAATSSWLPSVMRTHFIPSLGGR